ncbi:hypothetical protein ACQ86G_27295 [Roseateles chitinivorans]|uniref:hypothetical protein n=1 Tax=Roseateles chitinivorans TaxID=2917965 RepID=UPI003D671413
MLALLVAGGLSMPSLAQACSCLKRDAASLFKTSDRLVIARVTRVQYQRAWIGEARIWGDLQVLETLKASAGPPLTKVWTEPEISMCSLPLIVGQVYLLEPYGEDGIKVDHCSSRAIGTGDAQGEQLLRQLRQIRDERRRQAEASAGRQAPAASAGRR